MTEKNRWEIPATDSRRNLWKIQLSSIDTASGGSQKKNFVDGFWFKTDTLGFESFAEVLSYYVNKAYGYKTLKYEIGYIKAGMRQLVGVKSKDYSNGGEILCLEDLINEQNVSEAVEPISYRPFNMIGTEFYQFLVQEGARKPKLLVDPQPLYNCVYSMRDFYDESFINSRILLLQTRIDYIEYFAGAFS